MKINKELSLLTGINHTKLFDKLLSDGYKPVFSDNDFVWVNKNGEVKKVVVYSNGSSKIKDYKTSKRGKNELYLTIRIEGVIRSFYLNTIIKELFPGVIYKHQ